MNYADSLQLPKARVNWLKSRVCSLSEKRDLPRKEMDGEGVVEVWVPSVFTEQSSMSHLLEV